MKTKKCTKCKTPLPVSEFHKDKRNKNGLHTWCKICRDNQRKEYDKKYPWKKTFKTVKKRCDNPKNNRYYCYGGRGIKCLITADEIKKLWFRDKAYLMEKPSIDREDNDGHYCYDNCRYMELGKNVAKRNARVSIKPVLQYDLYGNFIRAWISQAEAGRGLKIHRSHISECCRGNQKTSGGFIWKYKKEN